MFRPCYDVILKLGGQKVELLAKARNAHREIVVFFGVLLRIKEYVGVNDVELHVREPLCACGEKDLDEIRNISVRKELGVDLQLSGHTHGGVAPIVRQLVSKHNSGYSRGIYRYGNGILYVSPGAGQWAGFPIRFFNPSEIAVFRLTKAKGGNRGQNR